MKHADMAGQFLVIFQIKKMQAYKPDSVFALANPYHLSRH